MVAGSQAGVCADARVVPVLGTFAHTPVFRLH